MKHLQTSFIKHLRITSALLSQNCLKTDFTIAHYAGEVCLAFLNGLLQFFLLHIHFYCHKYAGDIPI